MCLVVQWGKLQSRAVVSTMFHQVITPVNTVQAGETCIVCHVMLWMKEVWQNIPLDRINKRMFWSNTWHAIQIIYLICSRFIHKDFNF